MPSCSGSCQLSQPLFPFHPHADPLFHPLSPHTVSLIELDTRLIPFQHAPLQSPSSYPLHLPCQILEQASAISATTIFRQHEQIFEVDAGFSEPCGVVVEEERESCTGGRRARRKYQDRLCITRGEIIGVWNGEGEGGAE